MSAVPFLASLAPAGLPGPDASASYVRAARPPLFAAPDEEALSEASPGVSEPDLEEIAPEQQPRRRVQALPAPASSPSGHAAPAGDAGGARPVQSKAAGHAVAGTRPAPTVTPRGAKPRDARAAASKSRRAAGEPLQSPSTHPAISAPVSVVVQRSPLREQLRDQRQVAEQSSAAPIVHVTIDRIDVRAPAPTQPALLPPKARRAESQSLTDYLRQANPSGSDSLK